MCMCKKMVLAILIISIAFGTETEFQRRIILFRSSADRTFMFGNTGGGMSLPFEFLPALHLSWRHMDMISAGQEENKEIQQGGTDDKPGHNASGKAFEHQHCPVYNSQPLNLNRDNKHKQDLHLREGSCICQKYRHIDVIGAEGTEIHMKAVT